MNNPLIIALDFADKREVFRFMEQFSEEKLFLKVGMELFYQEGPAIVDDLKERGHHVFLDLKLHDIPNTVKNAMKGIARLGADLVNVHAAGGKAMMMAALEGLDSGTGAGNRRPYCIAVTQLTSTSEEQMKSEQLIAVSLQESVMHYAGLAKDAGLNGVVCSPHEAKMIQERFGSSFYTVTPGIRLESDETQDQKRVATPGFARQSGVSAIVVGRSITKAADPLQRYYEVKNDWEDVRS
ncbi:orotidine-5'-phosphate decarboxylase [Bacillus sp. V3-13]|uniref:orotidine-5'-phosphate decarboxylase n=1 Tax=Bacillus sp. V3-13 TaxID=2053728 RepID=UPI000C77C550|nr:orotidine-5'-phosphate decarboxylase [Bacillus sp. V3-13]PLR77574.1 orotidine-5'-phosphate decarboxylase [Bacillus sp. V3-13]